MTDTLKGGIGRILGIAGWSGAGKTTLLKQLIPALVDRGLTISSLKHAHHSFDVDKPGKDSHTLRMSGASEVLITSARRWALVHENRDAQEPGLEEMLARLSPVDLILIEGFKTYPHDKIEVYRQSNGKAPLYPDDPNIRAVVSDDSLYTNGIPVFPSGDIDRITDFVLTITGISVKTP